ncbi:class I SAM-dependent methyltransferase [Streptomyces sulphureus]|uniref:class I SAM-dependent methyltransferase n=1 Tax=Streptomyces sulphureus TaxID=47758 RepID=UPI00037EAA16|nr:class I SAM-dependent methyltransferase [Streptomyces sulphureus]
MKVPLTGAAATLLAPLYARALDASSPHPMLADSTAPELVQKIEYDFGALGMRPSNAVGVALRARFFDRRTREFLTAHPNSTVLHLGCGLDNRVDRVERGPGVRWFDVDQPEVIEVREQLFSPRSDHRTIAASVTETDWLAEVPTDLPVLVIAEGLTMYLAADEGPRMLRALVEHFSEGEAVFDTYARYAVRSTRSMALFRKTGARLAWGVDHPRELEREVPGLRLVKSVKAYHTADPADFRRLPFALRTRMRVDAEVLARLPVLGRVGHLSRYAFG